MPATCPRIQLLGSGFGHSASTSKRGASPAARLHGLLSGRLSQCPRPRADGWLTWHNLPFASDVVGLANASTVDDFGEHGIACVAGYPWVESAPRPRADPNLRRGGRVVERTALEMRLALFLPI